MKLYARQLVNCCVIHGQQECLNILGSVLLMIALKITSFYCFEVVQSDCLTSCVILSQVLVVGVCTFIVILHLLHINLAFALFKYISSSLLVIH